MCRLRPGLPRLPEEQGRKMTLIRTVRLWGQRGWLQHFLRAVMGSREQTVLRPQLSGLSSSRVSGREAVSSLALEA